MKQRTLPSVSPLYRGRINKATYNDQIVSSYSFNPLIEALPPHYEREEVFKHIRYAPAYSEEHRNLSMETRFLLLGEGRRFFEPLEPHFDLARRFSAMIRDGYVGRNPLSRDFWPRNYAAWAEIEQHLQHEPPLEFNLGMTLTGISGIGKSRAFERVTSLYPQVIEHSKYRSGTFIWQQLVWLKLDCPSSGSLNDLISNFFQHVDQILHTDYFNYYRIKDNPSRGATGAMSRVAANHSLGTLIIDEIQNLRTARSEEHDKLLNFLVNLDNSLGVPIVLIGTREAEAVLAGELRRARRAAGQSDKLWHCMQNDTVFEYFLQSLWKYQYLTEYTECTEELRNTLYYESMGITDLTIKVFFLAQAYAIVHQLPQLTRAIMQKAAKEGLRLVQPYLLLMRYNRQSELQHFPDLQTKEVEQAFQDPVKKWGDDAQPTPPDLSSVAPTNLVQLRKDQAHATPDITSAMRAKKQWHSTDLIIRVKNGIEKQHRTSYETLKKIGYIMPSTEMFEKGDSV